MSKMIVSWKYLIIDDKGVEKFFLFECIDSIKLELSYQVFLHLIKSKAPEKEIESKFKIVIVKNGYVDLSKLEIETFKKRKILKVIRDGNELPNKR